MSRTTERAIVLTVPVLVIVLLIADVPAWLGAIVAVLTGLVVAGVLRLGARAGWWAT